MPQEKLEGEFILNKSAKNLSFPSSREKLEDSHSKHEENLHFYTSLSHYPKKVTFENQEIDEEIILLVRRHLITNVPWILAAFVLVFIPPLLFLSSGLIAPFFQVSVQTQLVMALFYYLIVFGFIIVEFTLWYFNVGLVTNIRIIDLDVSGILFKHVSETRLNLIEDVSYSQVGSVRSIFNYGDVHMQTAGTLANFEFDRAPEPARIVRIIADMIGGKG